MKTIHKVLIALIIGYLVYRVFITLSDADRMKALEQAQARIDNVGSEKKVEMLFDIPSLIDKNIDEIKKVLGKPSVDTEPTKLQLEMDFKEWDKTFIKDGYELLVTFNPKTRKVIDFYIGTKDPSGKTKNYKDLLQVTNVENNLSTVIIEPVKIIKDPTYFNGIKIRRR